MKPDIRNATAKDYEKFLGVAPTSNFRGVVVTLDDDIIGIGGVLYEDKPKVFMDYRDELLNYKRAMVRATHMVVDRMKETCVICYALAQDDNKAINYIFHFGFEFSHYSRDGAVFKWLK